MKLSSTLLIAALAGPLGLLSAGLGQDPNPTGQAPPEQAGEPKSQSTGFQPGPGRIPPGTPPTALALWNRLTSATQPQVSVEAEAAGVRAFDVRFEVLQRQSSAEERTPGSVDGKTRVKRLRPDYVELTLEEGSLKQTGYGPSGYYINTEDGAIDISRDRDFKTDRELVQRTISLAKNLAGLANFEKLVLLDLRATEDPPPGDLPRRYLDVSPKRLDWLAILTPDFRLSEELAGGRAASDGEFPHLYRVHIGIDRESGEPRLIHVSKKPIPTQPTPPEQLVELRDPLRLDGWWLPKRMYLWERQPLSTDPRLQVFADSKADREAAILSGSRVNPPVEASEFDPVTTPSKR